MCKTYSIIQSVRLFYKFLCVDNKKLDVENEKVINKANISKKGWKKLSTLNQHFILIKTTMILKSYPQYVGNL